jgi:FAD/FMN-containing dehydrogenase
MTSPDRLSAPSPAQLHALERIAAVVGDSHCIRDAGPLEPYLVEERGQWRGTALMAVRPADTAQLAEVVRLCAEARLPIVAQGGNTGLCGGGVPQGGVVIATGRLNKIRAVDPVNRTMTVEAGCILAEIQAAALAAGCLFPLSLAAEGSCQIGGNLSTNAGGVNVVRYGNARDQVLGLEVVLPDGRVWDGLRALRKDNTGYDLKHLFIGAEGTLGIITAAVLKLAAKPQSIATAFAAVPDARAALRLLHAVQTALGDQLVAFEAMPRIGLDFCLRHIAGARDPFAAPHPLYALIELTSAQQTDALQAGLETVLGDALSEGFVEDAVIAASEAQRQAIWHLRETLPEAQKFEGGSIKHDIAVPVSRVPEFLARAAQTVERVMGEAGMAGTRIVAFGHLGDGNVHYNLSQPEGAERAAFMAVGPKINHAIHDLVHELGGSFSAEHGVGLYKRPDLRRYKPAVEVELMFAVKQTLDPQGLMNPGKIV